MVDYAAQVKSWNPTFPVASPQPFSDITAS